MKVRKSGFYLISLLQVIQALFNNVVAMMLFLSENLAPRFPSGADPYRPQNLPPNVLTRSEILEGSSDLTSEAAIFFKQSRAVILFPSMVDNNVTHTA